MAFLKIKEIAALQSGFPFGAEDFVEEGNVQVVQRHHHLHADAGVGGGPGDLQIEQAYDRLGYLFIGDEPGQARISNLNPEKTIQPGDVIFRSRASNFDKLRAYAPDVPKPSSSDEKPYVITNAFILLRPKRKIVPGYLAWAINSFRRDLLKYSSSSGAASLQMVSIKDLSEIRLPIPNLQIQESIFQASKEIEHFNHIIKITSYYLENTLLTQLAKKHS